MSYKYPHQDDSDENGFGESLQQAASSAQPHGSDGSDNDVFEESETHNLETTEDDEDEDEDDPDFEEEEEGDDDDDEYHGASCCKHLQYLPADYAVCAQVWTD